jgi:DNA-binding transcriptional LysR family regulator
METFDRQLRYFLQIAQLKSLSRAAEDLDQTQSGLSRQLAALEAHVGKALFVRTGRGVELTEAGRQLKEQTEGAFRTIDTALDTLRVRDGVTQGTVRLAVIHTLSYYFMGEVVARFVSQHESVNLSLLGRSSPEVVEFVESGKADVGFVYDSAVASAGVVSRPLFDDEMCLLVPEASDIGDRIDLTVHLPKLVAFPSHYMLRRSPDKLLIDHRLRKVAITRPALRRRVVVIVKAGRVLPPIVEHLVDAAIAIAAAS